MMVERFVAVLDTIGGFVSRVLLVIASVAMFSLVPMAGWLVYGRYILNASPTWVESASLVAIVIVTFFAAATAVREEQHLAIIFIRESFSPPVEAVMRLVSFALLAVFGVFMTRSAWQLVEFGWGREIPLLRIPDGVRHIPLFVCGVAMTYFSLVHILRIILSWRTIPPRREAAAPGAGAE